MTQESEPTSLLPGSGTEAMARAFGAQSRARLLARYLSSVEIESPAIAWQHVYRLLLWIDRTTALAHCYESDKAQPGRPWYARSLAFHDWVSTSLGVHPAELGAHIDWLFREATGELAQKPLDYRTAIYREQRAPYEGRGFPQPGEDAGLIRIVREDLGQWLVGEPPRETLQQLTRRIFAHVTQDNKRKNLVGEGFEDVVATIVTSFRPRGEIDIRKRVLLHELPGFHSPPPTEKPKKVDLAIVSKRRRTLVSVKWSVRADREEQFQSDFEAYARLESAGQDFAYVLVTNEFDAARLKAACERRRQNSPLFTHVVHINPEGVLAAYGGESGGSTGAVRAHVAIGRLMSLGDWLQQLVDDLD